MRADSTDCCGSCWGKAVWVSVSGVTVMDIVSSDAAVIWTPLDSDSWDFWEDLRPAWPKLWRGKKIHQHKLVSNIKFGQNVFSGVGLTPYLFGCLIIHLYGRNGIHAVQHRSLCPIQTRWIGKEGTGWYSTVSWRYRSDLPLEKLQNNIDVSCHTGLQSGEVGEREVNREL